MPSGGEPPLLVRVVGPLVVERDGLAVPATELTSRRGRTLLKLLAVEHGRPVPLDRIIETLWTDAVPRRPADNVAVLVSRLRRSLGPGAVVGGRAGYALGEGTTTDVARAAQLVEEAEHRLRGAEPALGAAAAAAALEMLGDGVVLPEDDGSWLDGPRRATTALLARARHAAAECHLLAHDPAAARTTATAALAADSLDELAVRQLMRAHVAAGEPAKALLTYDALRQELADSLGVDPAPQTRAAHLAALREEAGDPEAPPAPPVAPPGTGSTFVGRSAELGRLAEAWEQAAAGSAGLVLVRGEAGIGKTRLLAEAAALAGRTGGTVLSARCYETERSLFLQPLVDAMEPALATMPRQTLHELAGERLPALAALFPSVAALVGPLPVARGSASSERRQAFDAVTTVLRRLSEQRPILLVLDDLHLVGLATVELVHYLARHSRGARLLVLAGLRVGEGDDVTASLAEVARTIELGPLSDAAVRELAGGAGLADQADHIMAGTHGHALFVVETIRGLGAGETGVPASLREAIEVRVRRSGEDAEVLLRAAAVLGASFDPATVGALLGLSPTEAARRCEQLLGSRLVGLAGRDYEFVHDLVREVLYSTTPEPTRVAYHRAAADLLADRPEAVGAHAAAAHQWQRAGRAWLLAADAAASRFAHSDAEQLLERALAAAVAADDTELRARVHVTLGRVREVLVSFGAAEDDLVTAVQLAREAGDRRVEMRALLLLGGDVPVAMGRPVSELVAPLEGALRIAESLADRGAEADALGRLAVLACSRLQFTDAVDLGARAVSAARASGDEQALISALDGAKSGFAYLGDVRRLDTVVQELEPLLRRTGDLFRLQWTVFESSFVPMARADWPATVSLIDEAVALSRRSGWRSYDGWFHAHLGWVARLRGRHEEAVGHGRRSLVNPVDHGHPWWDAYVRSTLAATLLETGETIEATALLEEGLELAERGGASAYRLRCLALLARATGSSGLLEQGLVLLDSLSAPPGTAWLHGADVYLALASALADHGEAERAAAVLAPLTRWAGRAGWVPTTAQCALVSGRIALVSADDATARRRLSRARAEAEAHGMTYVADEAARLLELC